MIKKHKKHIFSIFSGFIVASFLLFFLFFSFSPLVFAQENVTSGDVFGTEQIDQNSALTGSSPMIIVARIINVSLGFLGIAAVLIVMYGGYIYLTSGGNEEKITIAKKILINGTIGLVIILSSWAIASFVLRSLGDATNVRGLDNANVPAACRDPEFANNNPDICLGGGNNGGGPLPGAENQDCAVNNRNVLLVRGITPSTPNQDQSTGMNNLKVRVLFNNALNFVPQNNPLNNEEVKKITSIFRLENNQEVDVTAGFEFRSVNNDPALFEATFRGQNGLDQVPAGQYVVRINKELKGRENQNFAQRVNCGEYPAEAIFRVNTNGVIDNQKPVIGAVFLNGQALDPQGEELQRGRVHTFTFPSIDNSGIGLAHFRVSVVRNGQQVSTFDYYDIPKVSRGSSATNENPFSVRFPLVVARNAELFDEYTVSATVFDIDGNTEQTQFRAIVVGSNCAPGNAGPECLNNNRACNNDLQCASKKCINNQCVAWPVITDVKRFWDGAAGNYVTIEGNYFGEANGKVEFGFQRPGGGANDIQWVLANAPVCDGRDLWKDNFIIVAVPEDAVLPVGSQSIIRVTKPIEVGQAEAFSDTTIDNHGPISGPNRGRFLKNNTKRPSLCSVGVAPGNPNIPEGATTGPQNTEIELVGTAFGNRDQGLVELGNVQGEILGWSDDRIRTRIPRNMNPGRVDISVLQKNIASNQLPFFVSSTIQSNRPRIISIDPESTTPKSYITVVGENFGDQTGAIFLAPENINTCREGGRINPACRQMDTETCGDAWANTQIIARVPEELASGVYRVLIERQNDLMQSDGQNTIRIAEGNPRPGICYFNPTSGPAPLAQGSPGLKFKGVNFSNDPKIYFWQRGADLQNVNTWFVQQGNAIQKVQRESTPVLTTVTTSIPVVNGNTLSMGPAPIRLKNAEGALSNQVVYTVNDCRQSPPLAGHQCCTEGPDEGVFKPNGQVCSGQTRDAGYAWRFTTGRIPEIPQVVERCVVPTPEGQEPAFPSPAPWQGWLGAEPACLNQSIVVRFQLPQNANLENVNQDTVKVFRCAERNGQADCSNANKEQVAYQAGDLDLTADNYLTILRNPLQGASRFLPNTWYQVEISKAITSVRNVIVGGVPVVERQNLLVKRSCSNDTAYCFSFKTGNENNRCDLDKVGVVPHPFRVNYLGVLQSAGLFDFSRPFNPAASSTLYYKVWGSGNQDCSVLDVQGYNWQWSSSERADARVERKQDNDTKAKVTALANTAPEHVVIQASSSTDRGEKIGRAHLTIDLGEPQIVDFWPNCTESCVEAEMGVRFDRQMMQNSFLGNIRLFECADELCNNPADVEKNIQESDKDYFTYRFVPIEPLKKSTWYKIEVSEAVLGVGSLGENDGAEDDVAGENITAFTWKFRTTSQMDGKCVVDKVEIQPRNFIARQIGERTKYNSFPRTAPNRCSALGQNLNPWMYGWNWSVSDQSVAQVSTFEYQGQVKPFCGLNCLPLGSDVAFGGQIRPSVCGNGTVDPGEDCDIANPNGEVVGVSCTLNCLRPGNRNVNNQLCGNGQVDIQQGEECDPRNPEHGAFCTNTCNWEGSELQAQNATGTAWCGSGAKTFGEDCDIANTSTSTSEGFLGCSNQCLHIGTPVSQDWCSKHKNDPYANSTIGATAECASALSVCGNAILEVGEECEFLPNAGGIQVALDLETDPNNPRSVHVQTNSLNVCNNRCLLGNICGLNAIPSVQENGPRCERGSQGCTDGCRIAGSSVTYNDSSFCGDGSVGRGEHPMCENNQPVPVQNRLGLNPVQMITAVGQGQVNNQTRLQESDVRAQVVKIKDQNGVAQNSPNQPTGVGKYALQCGYTETAPAQRGLFSESINDCPGDAVADNGDNRYGVGTNSCCSVRPTQIASYPEKGSVNVCRNTFISVSFDSFINEASLTDNILLVSGHGPQFRCGENEVNVTEQVRNFLAFEQSHDNGPQGFFAKMWSNVKGFFAKIFGVENANAIGENIAVWCAHPGFFDQAVAYESSDNLRSATTTVSLTLKDALLANTQYGVLMLGGNGRIENLQGIGVRSSVKLNGKYGQSEFVQFQTGNDICKIDHIEVSPAAEIFTRPGATSTFYASVVSERGGQLIASLPTIYAWEWNWAPARNDIFDIPAPETPANQDRVIVAAKNLEGKVTGSALAHVIVDVSVENNQFGRVFSAPFEMQAVFCENPWPPLPFFPYEEGIGFGKNRNNDGVNKVTREFDGTELAGIRIGNAQNGTDAYFNVSFSYCADANQAGTKQDDLPYLKPIVFGDFSQGVCQLPGGQARAPQIPVLHVKPGAAVAQRNNPNAVIGCTINAQCAILGKSATCVNNQVSQDPTLAEDVLKKFLFVNDKNEDVVGFQISQNPRRLSARSWYESQFPGANQNNLRDITIQGYDAVTDGNTYYINALNQAENYKSPVYNNIYIFSINPNAQADTKKVFQDLLASLEFNINISDVGYCLSSNKADDDGQQTLLQNFSRLTDITSQACQSDFDCRNPDGAPIEGSNGVCSNAKTKFLRDWKRLNDTRLTQQKLETYKNNAGQGRYPQISAGSFVPGYTNSRWGSWSTFGRDIGGAPVDPQPLNTWTRCGDLDPQTCWNPNTQTFHCPAKTSVIEYAVSGNGDYKLHVPLEYFSLSEPLNPVINEFIPALDKFTTSPWCVPNQVVAADAGQCGNGIVNRASGEECDPPQSVERTAFGLREGRDGQCEFTGDACQKSAEDCGYVVNLTGIWNAGVDAGPGEVIQNNRALPERNVRGILKSNAYCASSEDPQDVIIDMSQRDEKAGVSYYGLFPCGKDAQCQSIKMYERAPSVSVVQIQNNRRGTLPFGQFAQFFNQNKDQFRCIPVNAPAQGLRPLGQPAPLVNLPAQQCVGAVIAEGGVGQCPAGEDAARICTDQCRFSYGSCQSQGVCGNGRVESGEVCDSGALNGTYGQCNPTCSALGNQYCGNGTVDRGANGQKIESCEQVPYVARVFQAGDRSVRLVYNSQFNTRAFCERAFADDANGCNVLLNLVGIGGLNIAARTENGYGAHYCQNDKKLLCNPQNTVNGVNPDCLAPAEDKVVNLSTFNPAGGAEVIPWSNQNVNFGACVPINDNVYGSAYNHDRRFTCAASCAASGQYCGDGQIQAPYEQCDDQNNVNGDGCNKYCELEAQAVAQNNQPAVPLSCGNGVVDPAESCDLGNQNGVACTPEYGRSCNYCSGDCREVLTVDPNAFCGNNIFENNAEQCDVVNGVVTSVTSTPNGQMVCPRNYKGQFACNQCNSIANNCVLCGKIDRLSGGVVPRVGFLNPLTNSPAEKAEWNDVNKVGFYVKRDLGTGTRVFDFDTGLRYYLSGIYYRPIRPAADNFQNLFNEGEGVETDQLCSSEYGIVFNRQEMNAAGESCPNGRCPDPEMPDAGQYISENKQDLFSYPLSSEVGGISNEFIASPAVPEGVVRVVVKWTQAENEEQYRFQGLVHNSAFGQQSTIRLSDFNFRSCNSLRLNGANVATYPNYWWPDCDQNFLQGSVYVHPQVSGSKTFIQSFTIKTNGGANIALDKKRSYAFFVEALTQEGVTPIGNIRDRNVTVEIYTAQAAQNPKYSIYKPLYTYRLGGSGGSNPQARYWHVFNLVQLNQNSNNYDVRAPQTTRVNPQTNQNEVISFPSGKLATSLSDVLCYVPREQCRPEN